MIFNNKVWIVLRPNYTNGIYQIGICGTGFFIEPNKFITAYHVCNESSFSPDKNYNNNHIILLSPNNEIEKIFLNQCSFSKEKDIAYIKTNKNYSYLEIGDGLLNEDVYNIGYPGKNKEDLISNNLSIKEQRKTKGKIIEKSENYSVEFSNGCIRNKEVLIIDYLSEEGFSGGPLFNRNNKVIGLMSNINLKQKVTIVVSSKEFL